jgi:hypothetical protein
VCSGVDEGAVEMCLDSLRVRHLVTAVAANVEDAVTVVVVVVVCERVGAVSVAAAATA